MKNVIRFCPLKDKKMFPSGKVYQGVSYVKMTILVPL